MSVVASNTAGEQALRLHGSPNRGYDAPHNDSSKPVGIQFSLNDLRLGESFDTIKLDVGLLAWHIGHFPKENGAAGERVSEDDLYAILEISQNIGNNVDKIFALRNQNGVPTESESIQDGPLSPGEILQPLPSHPLQNMCARRKRADESSEDQRISTKRPRSITCRTCSTDHTPKWRNGPAGPGTLCNVCGLIYAKRRGRIRAAKDAPKQPSSC
ncbi:GATA-binding transcription factor [Metarhizium rileyi]|uniref:GATA-binding transcription factor n=1 Tax=Metarhizium rileyi (strain RCEF 4871) TaxID=1649241 RepID=A0A166WVU4_METRR|nr:GATA-binding transcription factor [Metarhizium rileyi RCEF 4871]